MRDVTGNELLEFRDLCFTGAAIQATGIALLFLAQNDETGSLTATGAAISFVGGLISFFSHTKIGKAGENLKESAKEIEKLSD